MAPYNALMYLFSPVRAKPHAGLRHFPELSALRQQWQMIRDACWASKPGTAFLLRAQVGGLALRSCT
jgi:hypothetical protein